MNVKKLLILLAIVIVVGGISGYLLLFNKNKIETKYYTYEGNGKFVMSSYANKVDDYKDLNKNYFIKEKISNEISDAEIVEVLYSGSFDEDYNTYGYYKVDEFNNYFSEQMEKGLLCDGEYKYYLEEGASYKCIKHPKGFKYQKIDSELCANINDQLVCIKPNDWANNDDYKKAFENVGWQCEYTNYSTGKTSENEVPSSGYLECSKTKPSLRNNGVNNELFCTITSDGGATCNYNNNNWCSINDDLNTYCFGID